MKNGFDEKFNPLKGLGYRELIDYHRGKLKIEEALEQSIARTKTFCRHQQTWFKKFSPAVWFEVSNSNHEDEILTLIQKHLNGEEISQ